MIYLGMDLDRERPDIPAVDHDSSIKVLFFGQEIPVDNCAKYICADANGEVYCFSHEETPQVSEEYNQWFAVSQCKVRYCGEVDLEGVNWRGTLRDITTYVHH